MNARNIRRSVSAAIVYIKLYKDHCSIFLMTYYDTLFPTYQNMSVCSVDRVSSPAASFTATCVCFDSSNFLFSYVSKCNLVTEESFLVRQRFRYLQFQYTFEQVSVLKMNFSTKRIQGLN